MFEKSGVKPQDYANCWVYIYGQSAPPGPQIYLYNNDMQIAHAFYDKRESGFVNGLLDAVAKDARK